MTQAAADIAMTTASEPLRLGLVGLGMAGGVMASVVGTHPGIVIAGAVEPDHDLRTSFCADHDVPVHADLIALLQRDDIDAVYIATPHQLHREQAILAAEHGKHIVVEKPMALTLADCDAMIAAAQANKVVLIVGHTHGFDPALGVMRDLSRDTLGPPAMISLLNYTDFLYRPRRPEELDTRLGGGILFNQIPHQVDMIRSLIDAPIRSVRAVTARLDPARPTEGACTALLEFANGAVATLTYSGYDGFDSDELHGWISEGGYDKAPAHGSARRALRVVPDQATEQTLRRTRYGYGSSLSTTAPPHQPHFGLMIVTCPGGEMRPSADGLHVYDAEGARDVAVPRTEWRSGRGDVLEALRLAVREDVAPRHDGAFGRATLEICLAILQSAQERREITFESELRP